MATVTLKLKFADSSVPKPIDSIALETHTPLDVMKFIVERGIHKKPPAGTIWLMRPLGWQIGDPSLDQFVSLKLNNVNPAVTLELIEVN